MNNVAEEILSVNFTKFFIFAFIFFQFNNFILCWYCTKAEANKKQPLITINMVKIYYVEADTKVRSMWQPYTAMSILH